MAPNLRDAARGRHTRRRSALVALATVALVTVGLLQMGDAARADTSDSANRLILWVNCERDVVDLTNAELDAWKAGGVDGFVCMVGRLRGMGGDQDFTGDPRADLSGGNYELQRDLRESNVVERAAARGMKMYLGFYLVNYYNRATPLKDWFDDRGWSQVVLPKVRALAAAAKLLGFAGLAFDQELYPQRGGARTATWNWDYPGNSHSEGGVRAEAARRGEQTMGAILAGFPGAELAVYHWYWPETWRELVQEEVYGRANAFANNVNWNFWDGLTSVEGYEAIRLYDSIFYKMPHLGTWDTAMQYNANRTLAFLSRNLSNWDYASSRVSITPFSWIDHGPNARKEISNSRRATAWDRARPPSYVQEQLLAMRKWSMGGEFANYAYGGLRSFDYSPYAGGTRAASRPGKVDGIDPRLEVASSGGGSASPPVIEGTAHDNLAIRAVRWYDDRGGSGAADMTWKVLSGGYDSGYEWRTRWSIPAKEISAGATQVKVIAEDIKGRRSAPASLAWDLRRTRPSKPRLTRKPARRLTVKRKRATVSFGFSSTPRPRAVACRLDRRRWRDCRGGSSSYRIRATRRWRRHTFKLWSLTAADGPDGRLVGYSFRIRRR